MAPYLKIVVLDKGTYQIVNQFDLGLASNKI